MPRAKHTAARLSQGLREGPLFLVSRADPFDGILYRLFSHAGEVDGADAAAGEASTPDWMIALMYVPLRYVPVVIELYSSESLKTS